MSGDTTSEAFPSAGEDARAAQAIEEIPQTRSPSYRLAYADRDFLLRDELRPVRLQLELLKPELLLQEHAVRSTIVVFGSSRIPEPASAKARHAEAESEARRAAADPERRRKAEIAGRIAEKSKYYEQARAFAQIVSCACQTPSERHFVMITGGGPGIMEAVNRGAHDVGARSIGLNIVIPAEQLPNRYITPELCFQFHYFAVRKMHFLIRARALVIFPGGFGTLDELFEALTLIQTGKIRPIPVLLFGEEYWRRVIDFDAMVDEGVISPEDVSIFRYVDTPDKAWEIIRAFYAEKEATAP